MHKVTKNLSHTEREERRKKKWKREEMEERALEDFGRDGQQPECSNYDDARKHCQSQQGKRFGFANRAAGTQGTAGKIG